MNTARSTPPRFLWQGLLILLPVAVLAVVGFVSIQQDRALAQHEAKERAQALADECASALWAQLTNETTIASFKHHVFQIDEQGRVTFPPPGSDWPVPAPVNLALLNPASRALWLSSQADATDAPSRRSATEACRQLIAAEPPQPFFALTRFRLGQLLAADGDFPTARAVFRAVAQDSPAVLTESGLPLGPLAECKAMELASRDTSVPKEIHAAALNDLCSKLVLQPTALTSRLLSRAEEIGSAILAPNIVAPWLEQWRNHEALRALAAAAMSSLPARGSNAPAVPQLFWFEARDLSPNPQPHLPPNRVLFPKAIDPNPRNRTSVTYHGPPLTTPLPPESSPPSPRTLPDTYSVHWLAARIDDRAEGASRIACRLIGRLPTATNGMASSSPAMIALIDSLPVLPEWFSASVEVAGITLIPRPDSRELVYRPSGKGGGQSWQEVAGYGSPEILASTRRGARDAEGLRVNIHLVNPQYLFARQQERTRIFGTLIVLSALAALIGFVSARRAFVRQQALSEMKSNFVSSVSHELRAPIASVRLMAESLERGKISEPAKQHEYFRFIVQECRRLGSLIENVLDFARIEQGRKQYEFEPTDLPALLRQTVKLMEPRAAERTVTLDLQIPADAFATPETQPIVDGAALQQALINLLDNAIKHSPPTAVVKVSLVAAPHSSFVLSVEDTGPGIAPEEHEKIFERFYRCGSELRRETQGVGIGLSIVKHIAEAHGGRVRVESEPGKGSRFTIELTMGTAETRRRGEGGT